MLRVNTWSVTKFIFLLYFGGFPFLLAQSGLILVHPQIYFKYKVVPLLEHDNTYFIVKILGENPIDKANRFSYNLQYGKSRSSFRLPFLDSPIALNVIPYASIVESIYYNTNDKLYRQTSIAEFCNNYFPLPKGEFFYELGLLDNRRNFNLPHYDYFAISEYFLVEPNQSVYIEIDIKNDSYTYKIIDTPKDIFSDMCK